MFKLLSSIAFAGILAVGITGCSGGPSPEDSDFRCQQDNVPAPEWTCMPKAEDGYAGLGVAMKSKAGYSFMLKEAQANGRSDLAQQIQTQVKDKIENFTRSTGVESSESVDKVTTAVTKQVAKVDLSGSKMVKSWTHPTKGTLYVLMLVKQTAVNQEVKNSIKTSFKNDDALWQQFQSKQALESLDKEFPTE